ncbi:hypothetical protein V1264_014296 [Littorina saxatilis]|uniref:MRH domain-containing protein n=1 Tax=Littorina saxatilis TaxID=31220 RepID=A0AAN9BS85_9CAEN
MVSVSLPCLLLAISWVLVSSEDPFAPPKTVNQVLHASFEPRIPTTGESAAGTRIARPHKFTPASSDSPHDVKDPIKTTPSVTASAIPADVRTSTNNTASINVRPGADVTARADIRTPSHVRKNSKGVTSVRAIEKNTATKQTPSVGGEPVGCRKVSPCVCETGTGQRVDLTPLGNTDGSPRFLDLLDQSGGPGYSYSWNPCYGFNEGICKDVAVCQTLPNSLPGNYNLGNQGSVDFETSSSSGLVMKYIGEGSPGLPQRLTFIQLQCDPDVEADFTVQGEQVTGSYYFTLRSRYACATLPTPPTLPTGGSNTVTFPGPTGNPIYSLKTVVNLLFVLTLVAVAGLVVLLLVLTVICVRRGMTTGSSDAHLLPPQYECHDKKQLLSV